MDFDSIVLQIHSRPSPRLRSAALTLDKTGQVGDPLFDASHPLFQGRHAVAETLVDGANPIAETPESGYDGDGDRRADRDHGDDDRDPFGGHSSVSA